MRVVLVLDTKLKKLTKIPVLTFDCLVTTVKSRFNEWPLSAHFHSLNKDFKLNRDFLMSNSNLVTRFCTLNWDFTLNRGSLNRDFTVLYLKRLNFELNSVNITDLRVIQGCQLRGGLSRPVSHLKTRGNNDNVRKKALRVLGMNCNRIRSRRCGHDWRPICWNSSVFLQKQWE